MNELVCTGLDGTDPVTAMATFGLLGVLELHDPAIRLSWHLDGVWRPVLATTLDQEMVCEAVIEALVGRKAAADREELETLECQLTALQEQERAAKVAPSDPNDKAARKAARQQALERKQAMAALKAAVKSAGSVLETCRRSVAERHAVCTMAKHLDDISGDGLSRFQFGELWRSHSPWYLPGLACDVDLVSKTKTTIARTVFSFANNNSGKQLLKDFANLAALATPTRVAESLFGTGAADYSITGLGWDPASQKSYALQAADPQQDVRCRPVHHALAFLGLGLLPVVPVGRDRATTGISSISARAAEAADDAEDEGEGATRRGRTSDHWSWPLWTSPITPAVVRSILACAVIQAPMPDVSRLRAMGIAEVRRTRRFSLNKRSYFAPSIPIA